jgi:16S rRNA (guanine966-N2)-methyltransferase
MRIISGTHKGRAFHPPKNLPVRPTTDFGKEALFNVLSNRIDFGTIRALDLFGGTGSISYELASRGCMDITTVDVNYNCCSFIKKTAAEFGFAGIRVIKQEVFKFLKQQSGSYDLIFADPPYEMPETVEIPELVFKGNFLKPDGLFILEHSDRLSFEGSPYFPEQRNYSKVNFSIFRLKGI